MYINVHSFICKVNTTVLGIFEVNVTSHSTFLASLKLHNPVVRRL